MTAMAKLDLEDFLGKEVTRVYIAGELREAKAVEKALSEHGIDFTVEVEPYKKMLLGIFFNEYAGAAFYVLSERATSARSALLAAGLKVGLQDEDASSIQTQT